MALKYLEGFETYFTNVNQNESYIRHAYPEITYGYYGSGCFISITGAYENNYALAFTGNLPPALYAYQALTLSDNVNHSGHYAILYHPRAFAHSHELEEWDYYSRSGMSFTVGLRYKINIPSGQWSNLRLVLPDHYSSEHRGYFIDIMSNHDGYNLNNSYKWGASSHIDYTGYIGGQWGQCYQSRSDNNSNNTWNYLEVYMNQYSISTPYMWKKNGKLQPIINPDMIVIIDGVPWHTFNPAAYTYTATDDTDPYPYMPSFSGIMLMFRNSPSGYHEIAVDDIYITDSAYWDDWDIPHANQGFLPYAYRSKMIGICPTGDSFRSWITPTGGYHYSYVNKPVGTGIYFSSTDIRITGIVDAYTTLSGLETYKFNNYNISYPTAGRIHGICLNATNLILSDGDGYDRIYGAISGYCSSKSYGLVDGDNAPVSLYYNDSYKSNQYVQIKFVTNNLPSIYMVNTVYNSYPWTFDIINQTGLIMGCWVI